MQAARIRVNSTFFILLASWFVPERYNFLTILHRIETKVHFRDFRRIWFAGIIIVFLLPVRHVTMKIRKVRLSEKDKRRAYRTAVRKAALESGLDRLTASRVHRNRKKYSRKGKERIIKEEEKLN
jgi:hypothetical protein